MLDLCGGLCAQCMYDVVAGSRLTFVGDVWPDRSRNLQAIVQDCQPQLARMTSVGADLKAVELTEIKVPDAGVAASAPPSAAKPKSKRTALNETCPICL